MASPKPKKRSARKQIKFNFKTKQFNQDVTNINEKKLRRVIIKAINAVQKKRKFEQRVTKLSRQKNFQKHYKKVEKFGVTEKAYARMVIRHRKYNSQVRAFNKKASTKKNLVEPYYFSFKQKNFDAVIKLSKTRGKPKSVINAQIDKFQKHIDMLKRNKVKPEIIDKVRQISVYDHERYDELLFYFTGLHYYKTDDELITNHTTFELGVLDAATRTLNKNWDPTQPNDETIYLIEKQVKSSENDYEIRIKRNY